MRTAKTITSSILAIGLLAGSAVGVTAQDEGSESVVTSFTGAFTSQFDVITWGTGAELDGLVGTSDFAAERSTVSSDPRLTGTVTMTANSLVDTNAEAPGDVGLNMLRASTFELTNDEGSWLGESVGFSNIEVGVSTDTVIFVGRGGYDGLTAVAVIDELGEFAGAIFPAAMPEIPAPYADE